MLVVQRSMTLFKGNIFGVFGFMNFTKHYRIYLFLVELALEFSTGLAQKSLIKQRNSRKGEEMLVIRLERANLSMWCVEGRHCRRIL